MALPNRDTLVDSGIEILYLWKMCAFLNPVLLLHDINGSLVFVRQSDYSACSDEFYLELSEINYLIILQLGASATLWRRMAPAVENREHKRRDTSDRSSSPIRYQRSPSRRSSHGSHLIGLVARSMFILLPFLCVIDFASSFSLQRP